MMGKRKDVPKDANSVRCDHYTDILNLLQEGTQNYNVWKYMHEYEFIDASKAYREFGILALHSRISSLRNLGAEIHTEMVHNNGKHYGVYSIEPEKHYCERTDEIECKFRDGCCHWNDEGCAWAEWLDDHPEYVTDDDDETVRRMTIICDDPRDEYRADEKEEAIWGW